MKRYRHYWWNLRGQYCPSRLVVLDCDPGPGDVGVTGNRGAVGINAWSLVADEMRHGERVDTKARSGKDIDELWSIIGHLCRSKDTSWLYMPRAYHMLSALGFWDRLIDGRAALVGNDWRQDRGQGRAGEDKADGLCCIEDPPTLILCRLGECPGKLMLLDIGNYGLEEISDGRSCTERAHYYMGGVRSIVQTLRQGVPVSLRGTAASQAVQALRTRYDCVRLHCHTHAASLALERAAYYGGRCECYRLGEIDGPVYHVDVRSMYPSVCLELPIPVSLRSYHDGERASGEAVRLGADRCVGDVDVEIKEPFLPCRDGGQIIYPVGRFRTVLCGPELNAAVLAGAVRRVHACAVYSCTDYLRPFYHEWLALLTAARAQGKVLLCQWIKRVMNALVGKFGEPGRRWVPTTPHTEMDPYCEWYGPGPGGLETRFRNVAWQTQRLESHGESYWSMPAVAGWITSAARVRLWDYHQAAGRETVWYTDTDALLCGQDGYDRLLRSGLIQENAIGHLRTLGCYGRATIYGIRHYQLDDTIRCAGVPRGAIRTGETREDYWGRMRATTEIALGRAPGTATGPGRSGRAEPYRHGIVGPDGSVTPLRIDNG